MKKFLYKTGIEVGEFFFYKITAFVRCLKIKRALKIREESSFSEILIFSDVENIHESG